MVVVVVAEVNTLNSGVHLISSSSISISANTKVCWPQAAAYLFPHHHQISAGHLAFIAVTLLAMSLRHLAFKTNQPTDPLVDRLAHLTFAAQVTCCLRPRSQLAQTLRIDRFWVAPLPPPLPPPPVTNWNALFRSASNKWRL